MKNTNLMVMGWILGLSAIAQAQSDCVGGGDIDGDGVVKLTDYALFHDCFSFEGLPQCTAQSFDRSDINGDGTVDLEDAAAFFNVMRHSYLPYGPHRDNQEAELLAMALTGQLRAPTVQYDRIERDLGLIRTAYPELTAVVDDPDYAPNQLIVGINETMPLDEYQELNEYFLLVDEEINTWGRVLTFCDNLNAPVLASSYVSLAEVEWADPNWFIGHDDVITVSTIGSTYRYNIDDGFHDCFDGCDCHRAWVIDVTAPGVVTLVSYDEFGQPWCDF